MIGVFAVTGSPLLTRYGPPAATVVFCSSDMRCPLFLGALHASGDRDCADLRNSPGDHCNLKLQVLADNEGRQLSNADRLAVNGCSCREGPGVPGDVDVSDCHVDRRGLTLDRDDPSRGIGGVGERDEFWFES